MSAPAPWRFDGHGINDNDGQRIATLTEHHKDGDHRVAHTLALASELAGMLETLVRSRPSRKASAWDHARALLARAKGGA